MVSYMTLRRLTLYHPLERDADEGVEGMSASCLRKATLEDDYETFKSGISKNLDDKTTKQLYNTIRKGMKVKTEGWQVAPKLFPTLCAKTILPRNSFRLVHGLRI